MSGLARLYMRCAVFIACEPLLILYLSRWRSVACQVGFGDFVVRKITFVSNNFLIDGHRCHTIY
jgi:hypothetical protein